MKKLLILAIILIAGMIGCKEEELGHTPLGDKIFSTFADSLNPHVVLDSKAQTQSFKYSDDYIEQTKHLEPREKGISIIIEYRNDIAIDTLDLRYVPYPYYPVEYKGKWYEIQAYDQYVTITVDENTSGESRDLLTKVAATGNFIGLCHITQSGAQ